jgi:hypothetical protein
VPVLPLPSFTAAARFPLNRFPCDPTLAKVLTKLHNIGYDNYLSNQNVSVSVAADAATSNIGVMRTVLISFGGNRNSIHAPEMFHFIKRFFYLYIV